MIRLILTWVFICTVSFTAKAQQLSLSASGASSYPCSLAYEILDRDGVSIQTGFVEVNSSSDQVNIDVQLSDRFAVQVYEDENRNQKLDRGFFTQPLEVYGFSNDAWTAFSKPSIEEMLVSSKGNPLVHIYLRSVGTIK